MLSYWEKTSLTHYDVIIVGGGITGLSTAVALKEKAGNLSVAVFERGVLPSGASTRNAGFACIGSAGEIADDLLHSTEDQVLQLVELRLQGLRMLRKRLGDKRIGYAEEGSYELITSAETALVDKVDTLNRLLLSVTGRSTFKVLNKQRCATFPFHKDYTQAIIQNHCEGALHTGEMMKHLHLFALEKGVVIHTGCTVTQVEEGSIEVLRTTTMEPLRFTCKKTVLCTNAFTPNFFPEQDIQPGRGIVLITKPLPKVPFKGIYHFDRGYYYFREIEGRVLFGGGRNEAFAEEATTSFEINQNIYKLLLEKLQTIILPQTVFEVDMHWAGIMAFGKNKQPIIAWATQNILLAARMGGMGVAIGSKAGDMAATQILETW